MVVLWHSAPPPTFDGHRMSGAASYGKPLPGRARANVQARAGSPGKSAAAWSSMSVGSICRPASRCRAAPAAAGAICNRSEADRPGSARVDLEADLRKRIPNETRTAATVAPVSLWGTFGSGEPRGHAFAVVNLRPFSTTPDAPSSALDATPGLGLALVSEPAIWQKAGSVAFLLGDDRKPLP